MRRIWYFFLFIIPMVIYPFTINGQPIEMRKIRELAFLSFAVVVCSFLQKSIWLRALCVWIIVNWWINLFPNYSYMPITNLLCALILYIGIKRFLQERILNITAISKLIAFTVIFQCGWVIMQIFKFDPIFKVKGFYW